MNYFNTILVNSYQAHPKYLTMRVAWAHVGTIFDLLHTYDIAQSGKAGLIPAHANWSY